MNHATPRMRDLAHRLIAIETGGEESSRTENQTALEVVQKLRPALEELMGSTGFHALVSRSLVLAEKEVPGLGGARMNADGGVEHFQETQVKTAPQPVSTGGAVMLAWLLGLLMSFIGEILTMQLVIEVWPDLSRKGSLQKGIKNEKTH